MGTELLKKKVRKAIDALPSDVSIRKVSLFGSYLHGDAQLDSDIDLLIEFTGPVGFFKFINVERRLSEALGKRVDLLTSDGLSKYFRSDVLSEAEILYES